jgi:hypothetical protein
MMWFEYLLYTTGGMVCLLGVVLFLCCDARYKRYRSGIGKDLSEKDGIYLLSSEKKSKNVILESGKLFSELAPTYLLWFTCFTIRSIYYICGGCR